MTKIRLLLELDVPTHVKKDPVEWPWQEWVNGAVGIGAVKVTPMQSEREPKTGWVKDPQYTYWTEEELAAEKEHLGSAFSADAAEEMHRKGEDHREREREARLRVVGDGS